MSKKSELEYLLKELLLGIQETLASGEILSDEFQGLLAKTINNLTSRIDEFDMQIQEEENTFPDIIQKQKTPVGTDLLYILAGGDIKAFVNYLRTYPGEGLAELANNPIRLAEVFQQLQQNIPISPPQIGSDGIPDASLQSSNVVGFSYNPKSQQLLVKFHGEPIEPIYQYDSVPPMIAELIMAGASQAKTKGQNKWGKWWPLKSPSLGSSVNTYLKQAGYEYKRIK